MCSNMFQVVDSIVDIPDDSSPLFTLLFRSDLKGDGDISSEMLTALSCFAPLCWKGQL